MSAITHRPISILSISIMCKTHLEVFLLKMEAIEREGQRIWNEKTMLMKDYFQSVYFQITFRHLVAAGA